MEPKWFPNGVQNEAWETILVSRGRSEGHVGGQREVWKVMRNTVRKRPDLMSGRACPGGDGHKWRGGVPDIKT